MARILVADDEQDIRDALVRVFSRDGHEVCVATNGREAVDLVRAEHPDLVVLDNRMPVLSGLEALARIREFDPAVVAVMFTAYDEPIDVHRAVIDLGAFGYLLKTSGIGAIRTTIQRALHSRSALREEAPAPAKEPAEGLDFGRMIGRSPPMQKIFDLIRRISHSDVTVLIQGESGTGKELVARAIHDHSLRAERAYVTVDCGTLPDTLMESEIFGYEAGAFTDARRTKPGKVEIADQGTLFLDEIGNLPLSAQAKLLRVIEDQRITRLGGNQVHEVDVRIVAATNLDLATAVRDRVFREDLYYRLDVFKLYLPPLRERPEDIPRLVDHYARRFAAEQGKSLSGGVSPEALALLAASTWPGNVRELRNVLERAVLLADDTVTPAHLPGLDGMPPEGARAPARPLPPAPFAGASPFRVPGAAADVAPTTDGIVLAPVDLDRVPLKDAKRIAGDAVERAYILEALRRSRWNKSKAARMLGLNYKTLREKVRDHDLDRLRYEA